MRDDLKKKFLKKLERKLQEPSEDQYIVNLIRAYYDLKDTQNLFEERLQEWIKNSMYLDVKDPKDPQVYESIRKHGFDESVYREFVDIYDVIRREERQIRQKIEQLIQSRFPNSSYLVGPFIVAMMLEKMGSYDKLVNAPASTIQVIGAEKALFKHIRSKGKIKPPKHGILYLSPWVNRLPKRLRGKMARTLASKLSIAMKADMAGRDIKEELYNKIRKRYEELEKEGKNRND
ncbi:MAG: hypothetical protein QXS53_02450 [Candidatus Anstonellales archaeon]